MKNLLLICLLLSAVGARAADVWINANPVASVGSNTTCAFSYTSLANYRKTAAAGWGWLQDTNSATHTVTDTNSVNTKIEYVSITGLAGCSSSPLSVPSDSMAKFRFTVYNAIPVGQPYWIKLSGFNP